MANILNIETSSKSCSVCLSKDGKVLASMQGKEAFEHSRDLTAFIETLMKDLDLNFKDLDAVAVNLGPGSYTALRVGLSAAKGLCFGLDLKLIAHSAFELLYGRANLELENNEDWNGIILPVIDARRAEVYMTAFDKSGREILEKQSFVLDEEALLAKIKTTSKILVVGDAAEKSKEYLTANNFDFMPLELDATFMCKISEEKYRLAKFEDLAYSTPLYLKPPNIVASKKKYF